MIWIILAVFFVFIVLSSRHVYDFLADRQWSTMPVIPEEVLTRQKSHRYPYCVVWTPIPVLSWVKMNNKRIKRASNFESKISSKIFTKIYHPQLDMSTHRPHRYRHFRGYNSWFRRFLLRSRRRYGVRCTHQSVEAGRRKSGRRKNRLRPRRQGGFPRLRWTCGKSTTRMPSNRMQANFWQFDVHMLNRSFVSAQFVPG